MKKWQHIIASCLFIVGLSGPSFAGSLFDDLGGYEQIKKIAARTIDLSAESPEIGGFFENSDLDRVKAKLAEQFCEITGGPCKYTGADMARLHKPLGISEKDFYALAEDARTAMSELGIPHRTQLRLIALLAPMHRDIVE